MSSPSEHEWALGYFSQGTQEKRCFLVWAQVVKSLAASTSHLWELFGKNCWLANSGAPQVKSETGPRHGRQGGTKERGRPSRRADGGLSKWGNLHRRPVSGSCKVRRSPPLSATSYMFTQSPELVQSHVQSTWAQHQLTLSRLCPWDISP